MRLRDVRAWPHSRPISFNRAIPQFAAEALGVLLTFLGVKYFSNWQNPIWKAFSEKSTSDWTAEDRDLRVNTFYHASKARFFNSKTLVKRVQISVSDLLDDNAVFLRDKTEGSYAGGEFQTQ